MIHQGSHKKSLRPIALLLLTSLLLAEQSEAFLINKAIEWAGQRVLRATLPAFAAQQPKMVKVIDAVSSKRRNRGDLEGADRMDAMRQWMSFSGFSGFKKGLPALALQALSSTQVFMDILKVVMARAEAFQTRAAVVGVMDTWQEQQKDINQAARTITARVMANFKPPSTDIVDAAQSSSTLTRGGPAKQFINDLLLVLKSDSYLARDILEEVMPASDARDTAVGWLQDLFIGLRSVLETEPSKVKQTPRSNKEL